MTNSKLQYAMNLFNSGRLAESEALLREIVEYEPNNETAWWWLSAATQDVEWQRYALEQVLRINPYNQEARQSLTNLSSSPPNFTNPEMGHTLPSPVITIPAEKSTNTLINVGRSTVRERQESGFQYKIDNMEQRIYDTISTTLDDTLGEHRNLAIHLFLTVFIAMSLACVCAWTMSALPSSFAVATPAPNQATPARPAAQERPTTSDQPNPQVEEAISFQVLTVTSVAFIFSWLTYIFPALIGLYFVIGYRLNGTWPHSNIFRLVLNLVLGRSRSLRRQITLTIILTILILPLILSIVSGAYLAPLAADEIVEEYYEIGIRINLILSLIIYSVVGFVFVYYLLAYVSNWQITDNNAHLLFGNQAPEIDRVYDEILARMQQRQLPAPYKAAFVTFTEKGNQSITEFAETTQLEITFKRARVAVRILEYGNDLYIRWDSYLDLSARRLSLLFGLLTSIFSSFLMWFTRQSLYEITMLLWGILVGKGFKSQGSQALPFSTLLSPAYVDWSFIPSYMTDDLYALEEAVNQSAVRVLKDIAVQAGIDEEIINMPIERNQNQSNNQNRLF